ncbi:hypothetical protein ABZ470_08205 [Streptosporangium sp. NPDC020072]|uniref:Secreted protein n=1 Tax=Streptosporangium jomthongense TaxID=1193683 RepID=A0ABV8F0Y0_9ACTN
MSRRVLTLLSGAVLAASAALSVAAPAQAAVVEQGQGPMNTGEYCAAKVSYGSELGFYEYGSIRCYSTDRNGRLVYKGSGDPVAACRYSHPTKVVVGAKEGLPGHYLICLIQE